jgi:hypothetical protein
MGVLQERFPGWPLSGASSRSGRISRRSAPGLLEIEADSSPALYSLVRTVPTLEQ